MREGEIGRAKSERERGGLVFEAHRLLYHSTLGLREIKKKKRVRNLLAYVEHVIHRFDVLPQTAQGLGLRV